MLEITDNLFGYIAHKSDMTEDVTKKYQNSLIFIGDENQIYQPLTNTYIGVGYSAFNNLRNSIIDSSHAYQIYVKDSLSNNATYYLPLLSTNDVDSFQSVYIGSNIGVNPSTGTIIGNLDGVASEAEKLHTPINITLQSTLYPGSYTYTGFDGSGNLVLNVPEELEEAIKTVEETTAYALNDLKNQIIDIDISDKFTEFVNAGGQNTRITIGNETKDLKIDADKVGGYHAENLLAYFNSTGLISSGNTLTFSKTNIVVGGVTKSIGPFSTTLINGLSIPNITSGITTNLKIDLNVNGVTTSQYIDKLYAFSAENIGGTAPGNLFTEFDNGNGNATRITFGGVSKDHYVNAAYFAGKTIGQIFDGFTGGTLSSSGNTITQSDHIISIGGNTQQAGSSSIRIINGLSIPNITSGITTNLTIDLDVNGVTTSQSLEKLYSYSAANLGGTTPYDLFSEFTSQPNNITRITIAGHSRDLAINSTYFAGKTLGEMLNSFTGGGLTSSNNTITQSEHVIGVGGKTIGAGSSSIKIINGLSIPNITSGITTNFKIDLNINGVTTSQSIDKLYAFSAENIGGTAPGNLFTEFGNGNGDATRITFGGVSKDHYVNAAYINGITIGALLNLFTGGTLSSAGNTITQGEHIIVVGGKTIGAGSSSIKIINGLSISSITSNANTNLTINLDVNGVTTSQSIDKLYAYSATNLGGTAPKDLFSEFSSQSNNITRITIAGHSRDLAINSAYFAGKTLSQLLDSFTGGGLTSVNNTITQLDHVIGVGGKTMGAGSSSVKIINGLSISNITSGLSTNLSLALSINGVTAGATLNELTAHNSYMFDGKRPNELFTEFKDGDGNQTKITIGGESKQHEISYAKNSDLSIRTGKFNTPINITLQSTIYPGTYTYTGFDGSGNLILKVPEELEQSIKTVEEVTAYALNDVRNQIIDLDLGSKFTEFSDAGSQNTRITIGTETKDLKIDADKLDGKHINELLYAFTAGGLTTNNNTITQLDHIINIGGKTLGAGSSSINIVKGVSVTSLTSNANTNLKIDLDVNGVTTSQSLEKLYAYNATNLGGTAPKDLFSEFSSQSNNTTRITIAGKTKELGINSAYFNGITLGQVFENMTGLSLSSSGNTVTLSQTDVVIGGKTITINASGAQIIRGLSIPNITSGITTNLKIDLNVNGITTSQHIDKLYAFSAENIGGTAPGELFTDFSTQGEYTQITFGGNSKQLLVNAAYLGGKTLSQLLDSFTGGGLTSSNNTITQLDHVIGVGGKTLGAGSSSTKIITGLSINSLTSSAASNLTIGLNVNGVTTSTSIEKIYAYSAVNLGGTEPKDLFSEFSSQADHNTRITIAGKTKELGIDSAYFNGITLGQVFETFNGGGLTSANNTITQLDHTIVVGGITKSAGSSSTKIINGISVYSLASGLSTNLSVALSINGVTAGATLNELTAHNSYMFDGKRPNELFTEFKDGDGNQTKITIGGESKQHEISYAKNSDLSIRTGKFNTPINITLQSTLYPGTYTYTGFDGSGNLVLQVPEELEQSIKTVEEVTAYALNDVRNQIIDLDFGSKFTEFSDAGSQNTRITIGNETKDLKIDADKLDGKHIDELLYAFTAGGLTTNNNTITQLDHIINIGGKTLGAGSSSINIVKGVSVTSLISGLSTNLSIGLAVNGITGGMTLGKIYAHNAANLGGTAPDKLFSSMTNDNDQLSITIAGHTEKLTLAYAVNSDTLDGKHASELFTYFGVEDDKLSITIGGTNYKQLVTYSSYAVNADTLDGKHASAFALSGHDHDNDYVNVGGDTMTGNLTAPGFIHSGLTVNQNSYVILAGGGTKEWKTDSSNNTLVARDNSGNINVHNIYANDIDAKVIKTDISTEDIDIGAVYIKGLTASDNQIRRIAFDDFVTKVQTANDNTYVKTITKSMKITQDWQNTGILTTNTTLFVSPGTYVVQINYNNGKSVYSGTMTVLNDGIDNDSEEIILHGSRNSNGLRLYLRTIAKSNNGNHYLELQIAGHISDTSNKNIVFTFKRII